MEGRATPSSVRRRGARTLIGMSRNFTLFEKQFTPSDLNNIVIICNFKNILANNTCFLRFLKKVLIHSRPPKYLVIKKIFGPSTQNKAWHLRTWLCLHPPFREVQCGSWLSVQASWKMSSKILCRVSSSIYWFKICSMPFRQPLGQPKNYFSPGWSPKYCWKEGGRCCPALGFLQMCRKVKVMWSV